MKLSARRGITSWESDPVLAFTSEPGERDATKHAYPQAAATDSGVESK